MSLRDPRGKVRDLRVQWADRGEAPSALAQLKSVGYEFSDEDEADSSEGEGGSETWSSPPRQASAWSRRSSILQQTLPTSPPERSHRCRETSIPDDDSEETQQGWRYNDYNTPSCTSESTCNDTYSSGSRETSASDRKGVRHRLLGAVVANQRGDWGEVGDEALIAGAVHESSSLLSPMFSPLRLHEEACKANLTADYPVSNRREVCSFKWRRERGPPLSPPLSPEAISISSTASPPGDGTGWGYSARPAFAPSGPFDTSRSKSCTNSFAPSTRDRFRHSSTAVHEPRARCGCRGLTVRVDSGLLGLSLEARYRIEHGLLLKQAWSDCAADRGIVSHSVHVQHLHSDGDKELCCGGTVDSGFESRSSSSGLIRVRTVDPESGEPRTAPVCESGSSALVGSPPPLRPGALSAKDSRRTSVPGVLEVEEGDILVRVDDVQVRRTTTPKNYEEKLRKLAGS